MTAYAFTGYEAGAHMAEETKNATKSAPYGIIFTCLATMITGLIYLVGLLYVMNDNIALVLNNQN
jgi:amino acid transporter